MPGEGGRRLAAEHGLPFTEADFKATFGQTNRTIIPRLWPGAARDLAEIDRWGEVKEVYYRDILHTDFPEMDGADELIAALAAAGFRLAVGSSGPKENVQAGLGGLANGHLFHATVNGGDVKHGKPDPEVFLLAARRLGLEPARCAVIEDAVVGLQACRSAGMTAIAITGTMPKEQLIPLADLVVETLRDLAPQRIAQLIDRPT